MADVLEEAQLLYNETLSASRDQRRQIEQDLEFSDPSDPKQWDEDVKRQREGDPGGKRPCLVHDQLGQYIANVAGQIEKQPPSIHAIPVGGGADKEAAEQIDGRFRHIEYASKASQHYQRSLTSAARVGVGYTVVRPEYIDRALGWQEPRIGSEGDALKVVFDAWSVATDGCDATYGYILTSLSDREWDRKWGKLKKRDFGDTETRKRDDSRKSIVIAEQWLKVDKFKPMVVYEDENGEPQSTDEDDFKLQQQMSGVSVQSLRTYKEKSCVVKWRRMSGEDVLEESDYPADSIGIVPTYGYISFVDGRMRYCGIARRARAPQQAYNYHISELMLPGAQLLASKRATKDVEPLWDKNQTERRAWLPWTDYDEDGAVNAPTLIKTGSSLIDHGAAAERSKEDIQASLGLYQANLGAPSNETSGVAIEGRKQQGEASTAHFPSHMAASLGQVGQIVMQMDANLSTAADKSVPGTSRRKQPILGVDGSAGSVTVDPDQEQAFQRGPEGVSINPKVGTYGVRVVVGASYSTQRSQTNAAFAEIMRGNPELAPTVVPFWAQTLDFPGSDKFAQACAAMAPAPVKAILTPEGANKGPDPAQLAHELDQCQKALQEAIQHAKDAQDDADQAIASAADAKRLGEVRERELDIEAYNAETNRLKITGANDQQIQAIVGDLINQMLAQPDPLPGEDGTHVPQLPATDLPQITLPEAGAQGQGDAPPQPNAPSPDAPAPMDTPDVQPSPPDQGMPA